MRGSDNMYVGVVYIRYQQKYAWGLIPEGCMVTPVSSPTITGR